MSFCACHLIQSTWKQAEAKISSDTEERYKPACTRHLVENHLQGSLHACRPTGYSPFLYVRMHYKHSAYIVLECIRITNSIYTPSEPFLGGTVLLCVG